MKIAITICNIGYLKILFTKGLIYCPIWPKSGDSVDNIKTSNMRRDLNED